MGLSRQRNEVWSTLLLGQEQPDAEKLRSTGATGGGEMEVAYATAAPVGQVLSNNAAGDGADRNEVAWHAQRKQRQGPIVEVTATGRPLLLEGGQYAG